MDTLIKIRADFSSEREAEAAVEKISPHCHNIRILYNGCPNNGHDNNISDYFEGLEPAFYDYNIMNGINTGWSLNPHGSYNFEHTRSYNYLSSLGIGRNAGKTILEADVPHEKYEFVKESLYSLGAFGVT